MGRQTQDDRRNCKVQAVEVGGMNRHAGSSRLVVRHRNVVQEEAGPGGAGSWRQEEGEGSRWDRQLGMQSSYLWIVGLREAGSPWCCKPDVNPVWAAMSCSGEGEAIAADSAGDRPPRQEVVGRQILEVDLVGGPLDGHCAPTWSRRGFLRAAPACRL